jgi:hypothetical protein
MGMAAGAKPLKCPIKIDLSVVGEPSSEQRSVSIFYRV